MTHYSASSFIPPHPPQVPGLLLLWSRVGGDRSRASATLTGVSWSRHAVSFSGGSFGTTKGVLSLLAFRFGQESFTGQQEIHKPAFL